MENYRSSENRLATFAIRGALLIMGIIFIPVGFVWLPVIGMVIGFSLIWLAFSPNLMKPYRRTIEILFGSRRRSFTQSGSVIPVTILSKRADDQTTEPFDARTVVPASVRLGSDRIESIPYPFGLEETNERVAGMNGKISSDVVFYFPVDELETSRDEVVCITAETLSGEIVKGCNRMEPVNSHV